MSVFFIAASKDDPNLADTIARVLPNDFYQISLSQWVIAAKTTSQGVSDLLGTTNGEFGKVLILPVIGFWGWHEKKLWEWIELKSKA